MDPDTALDLVKRGSTLLLLDVPQYTLIGIDTQMASVGPAFKGIKMIPPGVHFVYYSSSSRDGKEFTPMIGFFVETGPSEVIIRKWDAQEERLLKVSEEEESRYCRAVKSLEFDRQLGPYNLNLYGEWKQLSNFITKTVFKKIEPIGGEITVACEPDISRSAEVSQKGGCYYTYITRVVKHKGVHGQELTSLNLDKTQLLENLLVKEYGGSEDLLIGELQFAFVAFLMGQSLEAFFQWKSLVSLLFGCTEAPLHKRSRLFTKFIKVIYYQLKYCLQKDRPGTSSAGEMGASALLDDSWFSADSFLFRLCKDFFSLVQDAPVIDGDLLTQTRELKELLENTIGWEFERKSEVDGIYFDEDDEFAPVIEMLGD